MGPPDPFPAVPYEKAVTLLKKRYGRNAVRWDRPFDVVVIHMNIGIGLKRTLRLSWQQAKYLAVRLNLISDFDVMRGIFPVDWPA